MGLTPPVKSQYAGPAAGHAAALLQTGEVQRVGSSRLRWRGSEPRAEALSLDEAERVFIVKVVARHDGDVRLPAQQLGMSRSALYRKLQQYGVTE